MQKTRSIPLKGWLLLFSGIAVLRLSAQTTSCPPNIDFGNGNFEHWECQTGIVQSALGQNWVTWQAAGAVPDRHMMLSRQNTQLDYFGGFPQNCPYTNTYTVKLGNTLGFAEAEGLSYTYTIPAGTSDFSLLYYYAVVLQNPNHGPAEQPRFRARVVDVATNTEISCVSFDFVPGAGLPGFQLSQRGNVMYKSWTPVSVDLSAYAGKTIRLEFITSDCVFFEHFGYAYISISPLCNGTVKGGYVCNETNKISFTAPFGYNLYTWYADAGFSQVIGNAQTLTLQSPFTLGSVYPVVVTPYAGFGCRDTFYGVVKQAPPPLVDAGPDKITCSNEAISLGTTGHPLYSYSWMPAPFVSRPDIADPTTIPAFVTPTDFIVKATDPETLCVSYDTVRITPLVIDTSAVVSGKLAYCPGETVQTSISLNNSQAQIQWFRNNDPVNVTTPVLQPGSTGIYWAQLQQFGCVDSSTRYNIYFSPNPKAAFHFDKEVQCVGQPVNMINTSMIDNGSALGFEWRFSDGAVLHEQHVTKDFGSPGLHRALLIAQSPEGCRDSVEKTITIVEQCRPLMPSAFTPNADGRNDVLKAIVPGIKKFNRLTIYNRWGQIVFSSQEEGKGWDGSLKGILQPAGVYVWLLDYVNADGKQVMKRGTVTLIR